MDKFQLSKDIQQTVLLIRQRNHLPADYVHQFSNIDDLLSVVIESFLLSFQNEETKEKYRKVIDQFIKFLKIARNKHIFYTNGNDVLAWREDLRKTGGVAGAGDRDVWAFVPNDIATVENKTSALSSFFSYLIKPGVIVGRALLAYNPVTALPRRSSIQKYGKSKKTSLEIFKKILAQIDSRQDYCLYLGYFLTGMRFSEWIKIRPCDINRNVVPAIYDYIGKGNKKSSKIIPSIILEELDKLISPTAANENYYFSTDGNKPFSESKVLSKLKAYAKKAGLEEKITVHSLRHLHAETAVLLGINLETIRGSLKHQNLNTTQVYASSFGDSQNPLAQQLEQAILNPTQE